jgi:hypothetical protein
MLVYIDPGIGSVVVQAVIAGIVGFFYTMKLYGRRIKDFFTRKKDK